MFSHGTIPEAVGLFKPHISSRLSVIAKLKIWHDVQARKTIIAVTNLKLVFDELIKSSMNEGCEVQFLNSYSAKLSRVC